MALALSTRRETRVEPMPTPTTGRPKQAGIYGEGAKEDSISPVWLESGGPVANHALCSPNAFPSS